MTERSTTISPDLLQRPRDWLLCAVLTGLWFALTAALRPLALPDEGRYVGVAWEMLRSGDWLVPTQNGHPFFHKPPLFYWLTAASMAGLGPNVWAARLASVVTMTAVATALFVVTRRWRGARPAWTVVVVAATLPLFYGASQYANLDPLVAGCISLSILCVAQAVLAREGGRPAGALLAAGFAAAGAGVLAKGLIGVVLPILVLLGWGLASGRERERIGQRTVDVSAEGSAQRAGRRPGHRSARVLRAMAWWPGWLIFFAVAAPWFVAVQWRFDDFAHYFFIVQHLDRFVATGFNNPQPFWFYPAVLAGGTLPWALWAFAWLDPAFRRRPDPGGLRRLMVVWAVVVTVFFSLPQSKPVGYILPAVPPLAWLLADAVGWAIDRPATGRARWLYGITAAFAAALCVTAIVVAHFKQPKSHAAVAARLAAGRAPGEAVVFVGNYYFDVPLYARLEAPVLVADDWRAEDVARDSWRRELVDAETFRLPGWQHRLLHPDEIAAALRGRGTAWVVGPPVPPPGMAWLAARPPVFVHDGTALWRVEPNALPPAPTPGR